MKAYINKNHDLVEAAIVIGVILDHSEFAHWILESRDADGQNHIIHTGVELIKASFPSPGDYLVRMADGNYKIQSGQTFEAEYEQIHWH